MNAFNPRKKEHLSHCIRAEFDCFSLWLQSAKTANTIHINAVMNGNQSANELTATINPIEAGTYINSLVSVPGKRTGSV